MNSAGVGAAHHSQAPYSHPAAFQQLASHISQSSLSQRSSQKRRLEDDDQEGGRGVRDVAMDRSPTPERRKAVLPKRTRIAPPSDKAGGPSKENKDQEVDVGVLLASLPPESLLPLLTSLINSQPSLRTAVLSLIPRPSVDTAVQAVAQSAKRLRDAYPYSTTASLSSSPFGLGFGFNSRPTAFGSPMGFGRPSPPPHFQHSDTSGGMRDEYIISRLQPHIQEFASTCLSYLRYFSALPTVSGDDSQPSVFTKEKLVESFKFLEALMTHVLSQPSLTRASLLPQLQPRLVDEWRAWVNHVDELVNNQVVMFGQAEAEHWERVLNGYADAKGHGLDAMREVRDRWLAKVGWLAGPGRAPAQYMMQD
ncbi:hypothetical protein K488DRAFT_84949 [Vararia minispora EC-137]|uniref:Uncharacterized protein n=1 Tax=Vararia minispora EC-137 TaxID=1314806 RepID=A0ACB8QP12_9AGAM|nr:hypothetical protein K488DRAFT_84949 [Vararia minispora EC-137]